MDEEPTVNMMPPGGSVFDEISGREGPPLMRLFMIQGGFELANRVCKVGTKGKIIIVLVISVLFIAGDLVKFSQERAENIYSQIGLDRTATTADIDMIETNYRACLEFEPECDDPKKLGKIWKLEKQVVGEILYALKKPNLRAIYDKTEDFIRHKTLKKAPTEGQQYMSAFGEVAHFSIFILMTLMLVEQHQHFAKQMTIGLLLVFSYACVQLKMPKEVNADENIVIQAVNYLPFFDGFCYFEIIHILRSCIYPSLFNMTLNISRLIDKEPSLEFKRKIIEAQRKLTKTFLPLELLINKRKNDADFHAYAKKIFHDPLEKELEKEAAEEEAEKQVEAMDGAEAKSIEGKPEDEQKPDAAKEETPKAEDNQLVVDDAPKKTEEELAEEKRKKEEIDDHLSTYGRADPTILSAYEYVVYLRAKTTIDFLKQKEETKVAAQSFSCLSKCFSLIKTLLVYAVSSVVIIPIVYELYNAMDNEDDSGVTDFDSANSGFNDEDGHLTPEEIRKRAEDHEAANDAAFKKKMADMGVHDEDDYEEYVKAGDGVKVDDFDNNEEL